MRQIATIIHQSPRRRARQPVRRNSHRRGRCEQHFWRAMSRKEVRQILLAARIFDREHRQPGCANGPLGHIALEVLELLGNTVDYRTGRLEPSGAYIAGKIGRSRSAVVRALARLREHGFIDRMRRYEETGNEGAGPQVVQASNAYRMSLPRSAAKRMGRMGEAPPLPDDVAHALEERTAEWEAHRAALGLDELPLFEVEDDRLGRLLSELGRKVRERESTRGSETQSKGSKNI